MQSLNIKKEFYHLHLLERLPLCPLVLKGRHGRM